MTFSIAIYHLDTLLEILPTKRVKVPGNCGYILILGSQLDKTPSVKFPEYPLWENMPTTRHNSFSLFSLIAIHSPD